MPNMRIHGVQMMDWMNPTEEMTEARQIGYNEGRESRDDEVKELEARVMEFEEREAGCCPEDVGFEEYIATLEKRQTKYKVDGWNNFCRVFEMPPEFPNDFCFGGGQPVMFQQVDWFNPISGLPQPAVDKETWKENVGEIQVEEFTEQQLREKVLPFIQEKKYVHEGRRYMVIFSFGAVIAFVGGKGIVPTDIKNG